MLGDTALMWNSRLQNRFQVFVFILGLAVVSSPLRAQPVTWSEHIAPIMYESCTACHREGGVAPFSLMSYEDATERADEISDVVERRMMPPWLPDAVHGPALVGDRRLTDEQISQVLQWNEQGRKRGSSRRAPKPPQYSDPWSSGEPDLVLKLSEPVAGPVGGKEAYRNFVIPIPVTEPRYLEGLEFLPQSNAAIRSAVVQIDESDWSRRKDASDVGPGFDGWDLSGADNGGGQTASWSPGVGRIDTYPGAAWVLRPNVDLLVQLRVRASDVSEKIDPKIGLYFSEEPPSKTMASLVLHSGDGEDLSGDIDSIIEERLEVPVEASVIGLTPRAYATMKDVQVYAELPNGTQQRLISMSEWDSEWQQDYRFQEAVTIPAGSKFVFRYLLERPVEKRTGKLAEVAIRLILQDKADVAVISNAQTDFEIRKAGGVANYYFQQGVALETLGRVQDAITAYERAIREDSGHANANSNLGALYEVLGNKTQAEYYFREAIEADHSFHEARLNLARFFRKANRQEAAAKTLQEALDLDPSYLVARLELAMVLAEQKLLRSAIQLLEDGLKMDPTEPYLNLQTGKLYVMDGRPEEAIKYLERAAQGTEEDQKYEVPLDSILVEANMLPARLFQAAGDTQKMDQYLNRLFEIDPNNVDGRVFKVNLLLTSRRETEARQHLEVLLKQPIELQPHPEDLVQKLSFPEGIILLADTYKRTQRSKIGKGILEQALLVAEQRRNLIWITQIQNEIARYR